MLNNPQNPQENQDWALLLPTVTQCLNRQIIDKINLSRESIHFNTTSTYHPFADITTEDNEEYHISKQSLNENFFKTVLKNRQKTINENHKNKVPTYQINQLVYMKDMTPTGSTILKLPNRGPYKIKEICERNVTLIELSTGTETFTHIELIRPINLTEFRLILSKKWDISTQHPKYAKKNQEQSIFDNPTNQMTSEQALKTVNKIDEIEDEINLENLFYPPPDVPTHPAIRTLPPPPTPPPPLEAIPAKTNIEQDKDQNIEIKDEFNNDDLHLNINTIDIQQDISKQYKQSLQSNAKSQVTFKLTKNM
jgi:hypothetical protein